MTVKITISAALALVLSLNYAADRRDTCTFDLRAISKRIFESGGDERNFVTNPHFREKEDPSKPTSWRRANTHASKKGASAAEMAEIRKKIDSMVEVSLDEGMAAIAVPMAAVDLIGGRDEASRLHVYLNKRAMLDNDKGGKYRISLRYRSNHDYGYECYYAYVFTQPVYVDPATGRKTKKIGKWNAKDFHDTGADSDYMNLWSHEVRIPPGANAVDFTIRFMGAGYLKFTDFRLVECGEEEKSRSDVKFFVKPYGSADNTFAIESGDVGAIEIAWNRSKTSKIDWWKSYLEVVLPEGFTFIGANMSDIRRKRKIERVRREDGSERIRLPMGNNINPLPVETFIDSTAISLLIRADGPVGKEGTLAYRAIGSDGKPCDDAGSCRLTTVEPFTVVQPKRYRIGAMLTYALQLFRSSPEANEVYADYLRSKGVTWIMPQTDWLVEDKTLLPMWRKKGFDIITPTDHKYLMNAYNIHGTTARPKEDAFGPKPGVDPKLAKAACPASIYEERAFFVTNIVPNLAARSAGTDGEWINWEPYFFKGCYCDYCKKLGAEWMAKTGDGNIEHFHSWQHGMLVKTVHKWMKKTFSPGRIGLMPAISWDEMCTEAHKAAWPEDKLTADYAGDVDWIPAWGPYVGWSPWAGGPYGGPYGIQKGRCLLVFFAAKDIREETDRFFKPGKRPKLMGQPAGTNWLIQPEWLEISCDAYFFNRWEAIAPWIFPQGADARHWKAFGASVNRAAKYENVVWDGRRNDSASTLVPAAGFDERSSVLDNRAFPGVRNVPLIQQVTYDYGQDRYVACFNFNDERHAEFTLKTSSLPAGKYRIFGEDGKAVCGGRIFSADDLAGEGAALRLPASACRVFTIKKEGN